MATNVQFIPNTTILFESYLRPNITTTLGTTSSDNNTGIALYIVNNSTFSTATVVVTITNNNGVVYSNSYFLAAQRVSSLINISNVANSTVNVAIYGSNTCYGYLVYNSAFTLSNNNEFLINEIINSPNVIPTETTVTSAVSDYTQATAADIDQLILTSLKPMSSDIGNISTQIVNLQYNIETLTNNTNQSNSALNDQINTVESNLSTTMNSLTAQNQVAIHSLSDNVNTLYESLDNKIISNQETSNQINNTLSNVQNNVSNYETQLSSLAIKLNDLSGVWELYPNLEETITNITILSDLASTVNDKNLQISDFQNVIDDLSNQIESNTNQINGTNLSVEEQNTNIISLSSSVSNIDNDIVNLIVPSISNLLNVSTTNIIPIQVLYYHINIHIARGPFYSESGGVFYWDPDCEKSLHNGGTIIDPLAPYPSDWTNQSELITWFNSSNSGTGCWIRKLTENYLNVKWFGAKGDNVTDDTLPIQATINCAIKNQFNSDVNLYDFYYTKEIYMPSGQYITTDTIQLGYGIGYMGIRLKGAGSQYPQTFVNGTTIFPQFSDRPCIALQGMRHSRVKGMTLIGLNYNYITTNQLGSFNSTMDDTDISAWVSPDLAATASSQYAPYAGIAIDPYSSAQPSVAYPPVNYPSWTGITEQYNKSSSSWIEFDDLFISGFYCGIVSQPCESAGSGDFMRFYRCSLTTNAIAYSTGAWDARLTDFLDCALGGCHTSVTNNTSGSQSGEIHMSFRLCDFDWTIQVMNISNGNGSPLFDTCYGEQVWSLGYIGGIDDGAPGNFLNCNFLVLWNTAYRGVPTYFIDGTGQVVMKSTQFQFSGDGFANINYNIDFITEQCFSTSFFYTSDIPSVIANNYTKNRVFTPTNKLGVSSQLFNIDTLAQYYYGPSAEPLPKGVNTRSVNAGRHPTIQEQFNLYEYMNPPVPVPGDYFTSITVSGRTVTLVGPENLNTFISYYSMDIGDIIMGDNNIIPYLITDASYTSSGGTVLTATAMSGFDMNGVVSQSFTTTNGPAHSLFHTRQYGLPAEYLCTVTQGSTTVNVQRFSDGDTSTIESIFVVGDRFMNEGALANILYVGDNTKIAAASNTAGTITLSTPARRSVTGLVASLSRTFNS